ncbi:hypothetical protein [Streptomyces hydrogenans]|uniref:hypothetical protein n=1 Tax=Streptomyces hydrogenans TaxID=1873719 RepID=UPI003819C49A
MGIDSGDIIAGASAVVAVAAAVISGRQAKHAKAQVTLAHKQLELAEKVHREQNEPYVLVDIQTGGPGEHLLFLIVENIGSTVARNVRITSDPPIESGLPDVTEMLQVALGRTYPMIPPGRRLEFVFDGPERFGNTGLPTLYTFTVRSEGPHGAVEDLEHVTDFSTLAESLIKPRPTKVVEDKLDKIQKSLKTLSDAYAQANAPAIHEEGQRRHQAYLARRAGQIPQQQEPSSEPTSNEAPSTAPE